MEDLAEVSMEQEFSAAETGTPEVAEDLPVAESTAEEAPVTETNEETMNETIVSEEEIAEPEVTEESAPDESDGHESTEQVFPEIDAQVFAGWQELAKAHPEVVGKPLPDDIMKTIVESGLPPLRVYESMMLVKQGEQIAALQQEIATLKQNAEASQRAPVTAASLGGNEGNDPNDVFLREFNS